MKTFLTAAAVVTAASVVTLSPTAAHAEDRRPCVSNREFNSVYIQSRDALEDRWEVTGLGRQTETPMFGSVTAYPWCGHKMSDAWVGIKYGRRGTHLLALDIVLYKAGDDGVAPEAPPAVTPTEPPTIIACDVTC